MDLLPECAARKEVGDPDEEHECWEPKPEQGETCAVAA